MIPFMQTPFSDEIDYRRFAIKTAERDVPRIKRILLAVPEVRGLLSVASSWPVLPFCLVGLWLEMRSLS